MEIPVSPWERWAYRFGLAGEGQADLIERALIREPGTVLDIGCGPQGRHAANLAALSKLLIAADKDSGMVRSARSDRPMPTNVRFLVADAFNLPFSCNSIDHVIALGLFAYVKEPDGVLGEFRRVIRRHGKIFASNSVAHERGMLIRAATAVGLRLTHDLEGRCPAASGPVKRRYLCVFEPS